IRPAKSGFTFIMLATTGNVAARLLRALSSPLSVARMNLGHVSWCQVTYHGTYHGVMARIMVSGLSRSLYLRITAAEFAQPFRGQVAAQSLFTCPIEDKAGDGGELPAELVIARFVGKQGLFVRSSSFDPLAEKFAGLDRARRRGRDLRILDILRTELAEMIVLNPRLGAVD